MGLQTSKEETTGQIIILENAYKPKKNYYLMSPADVSHHNNYETYVINDLSCISVSLRILQLLRWFCKIFSTVKSN